MNAMKYNKEATSVLLVGYNGANNTGSEARLLPIIEDVRYVFGRMFVMYLDKIV